MKFSFKQFFQKHGAETRVEGEPDRAASISGIYKGIALGLLLVAAFFLIYSQIEKREFPVRFLEAITSNQEEVVRLSRNRFAQEYENLMFGYQAMRTGTEVTGIFDTMDAVEGMSLEIKAAAKEAETTFPYDEFSPSEQEKIRAYFGVLKQMDDGRHAYIENLSDCLRLTYLDEDEAEKFCNTISEEWNTLAEKLLGDLTATLGLSDEEEREFRGVR